LDSRIKSLKQDLNYFNKIVAKTNRIAIVCYVYNHLELMALTKALKVSPEWLLDEEL
jgi:phenolic acid decarboxylase